jgi:tripartite-type tricarboxylate transporter receptor subunit TctC
MFSRNLVRLVMGLLVAACAATSFAQAPYPSHSVRLVVTYPPGGASDLMARLLAEKLNSQWKQTVVVENKPGAAGSMGTEYAAHLPADGYTFLMGNMGPSVVNPLLSKVPYDMARDFIPVSLVATGPSVLVVNGKSPYKTLAELVAAAKAKPNTLNFGSGGAGTLAHLTGEMFNHAAGVQIQHVPYKGGIAAVNDLLGSQIDMVPADTQAVVQHIKSGALRALAVTSEKRVPLLPNVPTFAESGMPELVALNSWGVYLPAGTPKPIVDTFKASLDKAMTDPDLVKRYAELGVDALHTSADELRSFNAAETAKYAKIIKEKNIRAD